MKRLVDFTSEIEDFASDDGVDFAIDASASSMTDGGIEAMIDFSVGDIFRPGVDDGIVAGLFLVSEPGAFLECG